MIKLPQDCTTCRHYPKDQEGTWKPSNRQRCGKCEFVKVKTLWQPRKNVLEKKKSSISESVDHAST
jgi:hypothetical protein